MNVFSRMILALALLAAPFWLAAPSALAQDDDPLQISVPDIEDFPALRLYLNAYDAQGNFLADLQPGDLRVLENGQELTPSALAVVPNGVQVILALNTSPNMANLTPSGESGFQQIQSALVEWASQQPDGTLDDVSLATPTGLFLIRERSPERVAQALRDYQPDLQSSQPSLNSLAEALDMATDPLERPLMKRAILFITPPLPASADAPVADLVSRAVSIGVRVHVWLVMPPGAPPVASPLQGLADATGGQLQEVILGLPSPMVEPLFQPLRQTYELRYDSAIRASGSQRVRVLLGSAGERQRSNETRFTLELAPPNPIFLSPPVTVERTWETSITTGEASLTPAEIPLKILIEFPDQRARALKATRLYVDGALVAENTRAPFDSFNWPLDGLDQPDRHALRVEVEDSLGLSGASEELPVEVLIAAPAGNSLGSRVSGSGAVAIGAVAAAGAVLALVLFLSGSQRRFRRRPRIDKKLQNDPVTQPVKIRQEPARGRQKKEKSAARPAPSWPAWMHHPPTQAPARLIALSENEEPITGGAFPLNRQEITLGTDPRRATQVLESATVDGLHARLYRETDGCYYLADQDSVAGTWINYAPVTSSGARLEHGDLIHVGKVMFRFELAAPERIPTVAVQMLDADQ